MIRPALASETAHFFQVIYFLTLIVFFLKHVRFPMHPKIHSHAVLSDAGRDGRGRDAASALRGRGVSTAPAPALSSAAATGAGRGGSVTSVSERRYLDEKQKF